MEWVQSAGVHARLSKTRRKADSGGGGTGAAAVSVRGTCSEAVNGGKASCKTCHSTYILYYCTSLRNSALGLTRTETAE